MSYFQNLREFLGKLEELGRLRRITTPVDKDRELHPLVKWQYRGLEESERFGFVFDHVVDRHGRRYDGHVASSVIAANREMYALAMGCPLDQLHARWAQALSNFIPPQKVFRAAVKEEVHKGSALLEHGGFAEFPIPVATNGWEAFPRITAAAFFTRDPELGTLNAGMYNSVVLGPLRANIRTSRHLRNHWNKCRIMGKPLEVAAVIGALPVVSFTAATNIPDGISELDVAGGLIGEPVEVVSCETVDLEVPAAAEIVIEGEIPTDLMDRDGPSGENRGHVMPGGLVHAFQVTCITHRRNPIWHDIICQFPPSESSVMRAVNCEGQVSALLRAHGISYVTEVAFHHCGSAKHFCVIRLRDIQGSQLSNSRVWHALFTVLAADPGWPKIVIAVNEDIDPWDLESVFWAVINRSQPHRDIKIIQGRSAGLDESIGPRDLPPRERSYPSSVHSPQGASGMLIDATLKWANPPISLPRKEYMEHGRELWEKLGLPKLKPKEPWYGVSLGHWTEQEQQLVDLAEQGRVDEAAQLLLSQSRKLDDVKKGN
jgi:UbiD family decarboxylase